MSNQFTIEHNSAAVSEVLRQLSEQLSDLTDPMQQIAAVMADATEEALELEADPATGEPWEELSDNYLKANPKRVGGKMLQLSAGGLVSSITTDHGPTFAQIGSNKIYAAIHQFGGEDDMAPGPAAIPARPYLGLTADHETEILDILQQYLARV